MSASSRDADDETPRPRTDWGRVADGVGLAGLGVFFLVATTRGLPDGFWMEAVSFWPVLLVSAGIRIVFEKTPLAAGMVLGPVVVVGTLFWLAWGNPPEPRPPGEWHELAAVRPEGAKRVRVRGELLGVEVTLEARALGPAVLAEGRAASREDMPRLDLDVGDGTVDLNLEGRHSGFTMMGRRREVWELAVTDDLPLQLDFSGAVTRGDLDLRRGRVTGAEVQGAFNSWTICLPPPSRSARIQFKGAFSSYTVTVPEGTPVRYEGPGFPLVWLDKGPARDTIEKDTPGYDVVLEGAFSVVNIEESAAPEGGWPPPRPVLETGDTQSEGAPSTEATPRPPAEAPPATGRSESPTPREDPGGA